MSNYGYSSDPSGSGYYSGSGYTTPQYTQAQLNAYYAQYGCYPPGYYQQGAQGQPQPQQQQQQHGAIAGTPYGSGASSGYGQPAPATSAYEHGYLSNTTAPGVPRPRSPRVWKCDIPNCTSNANFTRLADLQRHQSTVHGVGTPDFPCTVKDCTRVGEKGFTRRDHLVEHLRNFHHIDIPKRRPGERSAYPLGLPDYQ